MRTHRIEVFCSTNWAILSLLIVPFLSARAQIVQLNQVALVQAQSQPSLAQETMPSAGAAGNTIPSSPNDADLGEQQILKREEAYQPFSALFTTPIFFTSNVALTNRGVVSDVVEAPTAAVFYDSKLIQNLYVHLGAQEQIFYYDKYTSFNFGSLDCQAGLSYVVPNLHNLLLRAWYDFNRLTLADELGNEFFSNHQVLLDAEVPFQFGRAQQLSLGTDANLSVGADHQFPRRNDYEAYAVYSVGLTRSFLIQAGGRVVVREYHQNGRTDVSEILSASATYRFANWGALSAISSFAHSDCNQSVFDYDVANVGGSLELSIKF
jgi:hypothetical protein